MTELEKITEKEAKNLTWTSGTTTTSDSHQITCYTTALGSYSSTITTSYEAEKEAPKRRNPITGLTAKIVAAVMLLAGCMPQYARISYGSHKPTDDSMPAAGLVDMSYGIKPSGKGWGFEAGVGARDEVHREGNQGGVDWSSDHSAVRYRVLGTYYLPRKGVFQASFFAGFDGLAEEQTDIIGPPIDVTETQTNFSSGFTGGARVSVGNQKASFDLEFGYTKYGEIGATTFSVGGTINF